VHPNRPWLNTLLARALLALVLVLAQQTASLHWLSHSIEATQGKGQHKPGDSLHDPCDECLALGALGAAATGSDLPVVALPYRHALVALEAPASAPSQLALGFRSRAPPIPV